jgi:hypothetical protein
LIVTPGLARDEKQGDPVRVLPLGAKGRDDDVGDVRVGDEHFPTRQAIGLADFAGAGRDAGRVQPIALFQPCQRADDLAGCQSRQPSLLLRTRAAVHDRQGGQHCRGEERARHHHLAELLEQECEIEQLQLGAAVGFRHHQPHPPELRHLAIERARKAFLVARRLAHQTRRALAGEELRRRALQHLLIFVESEIHGINSKYVTGDQ